jgi:hypothetical protein
MITIHTVHRDLTVLLRYFFKFCTLLTRVKCNANITRLYNSKKIVLIIIVLLTVVIQLSG